MCSFLKKKKKKKNSNSTLHADRLFREHIFFAYPTNFTANFDGSAFVEKRNKSCFC